MTEKKLKKQISYWCIRILSVIRRNNGQAMITGVLFLLSASLVLIFGISAPLLAELRIVGNLKNSNQSFYTSEGLLEDVVLRLKRGEPVSSYEGLSFGGVNVSLSVAETSSGKEITVVGDSNNHQRKSKTVLTFGEGAAFHYGVQSGNGGFVLEGGSSIDGNVYSNGDIIGDGGASVTGSVTAANPVATTVAISNDSPTSPTSSINFGTANASQDVAQSFQVSTLGPLTTVDFYIKKSTTNTQSDPLVKIVNDNAGVPGTTVLSQATLPVSQITTSFGWVSVNLDNALQLPVNTTYWVVLDKTNNSSSNYLTIASNANTSYGGGSLQSKVGRLGSSWGTTPNQDVYFKIKFGGGDSVITGDGYDYLRVGTGSSGDAWAYEVKSTNTSGTVYCQVGSMNNGKNCNTSKGIPPPAGDPVSSSLIDSWKNEASAGTVINGNYSVGWQGATLGPAKIIGNLTVSGGGKLTLTGTLYVTGNVIFTGGGKLALSSVYGSSSGVLIADGTINVSGGGQFTGSGFSGSYPFAVSTSYCPVGPNCSGAPAIYITGGAGAVVLVAPYGTLNMDGGTSARALAAYKIRVSSGGSVTYDSGLVDVSFSSGPSGGYEIESWAEVE